MATYRFLFIIEKAEHNYAAYVPDLPTQIVFTARKQDATVEVAVHEYSFDVSRK